MKLVHTYILALIGLVSINASAQQTPLFGFNSQLLNISNPSMSKSTSPFNLTMAGRKYWTGIQGSPEAFIGAFSLSPEQYKSAFGGFFWGEKSPMLNKQIVGFNYAYSIKNMEENTNLRLGVGMDLISVSSNITSVITEDYNDPFYTSMFSNNKSSVDFRTGATWNNEVFEAGIAIQQLIRSKNTLGESVNDKLDFKNQRITNGHFKYTIQTDEDVKITPLVFWQIQKSVPLRLDINVLAEKTGKLWGGLWLRPKSAFGVMAGIWALPDLKIGYMYEKTFLKKVSKLGNSHELIISYIPTFAAKEKNPESDLDKKYKEKPEPEIIRIKDTVVIVKETRVIETPQKTTPTRVEEQKETISPPTSTSPSSSGGDFYVVTGLFSLEANAKNYSKKLQSEGFKTSLVKNPSTNQFYVSIGNFKSIEEAHKFISSVPNPKYTFWVKEIK
jgi:type IX secretion system PorP/SprF family membrane protein